MVNGEAIPPFWPNSVIVLDNVSMKVCSETGNNQMAGREQHFMFC